MVVNAALTTKIRTTQTYYRITAQSFWTPNPSNHAQVVNGLGARRSRHGARYNFPGVVTVYIAEDLETVLAEKMFYFQREVIQQIDLSHIMLGNPLPPFTQDFVLWEIEFAQDVPDVLDLNLASASYAGIIPSLMVNPSQDYQHLRDRRAWIESNGYKGLRAPSSRSTNGGRIVALFDDQSLNVRRIVPFGVSLSMITSTSPLKQFANHMTDQLDFSAGAVVIPNCTDPVFRTPTKLKFNH
jgi:hypothetical protein